MLRKNDGRRFSDTILLQDQASNLGFKSSARPDPVQPRALKMVLSEKQYKAGPAHKAPSSATQHPSVSGKLLNFSVNVSSIW